MDFFVEGGWDVRRRRKVTVKESVGGRGGSGGFLF